jgi:pyruvate/2-oxoglutarate dehydrogenase complex dihydrolipoamide acyltransferase (E2) component
MEGFSMMDIVLPFLAEGVDEATVSFWKVDEGDDVADEDELVEMFTSKAVFSVPSPTSGMVEEIIVTEGEVVRVGQILCRINEK